MTSSIETSQNESPSAICHDKITISMEERLKAMAEMARQRLEQKRQDVAAFVATQPASKPCPVHPNCLRPMDLRATDEILRHVSTLQVVYAPCPECIQDAANRELKKFGVPENLIHATFENFLPADDLEAEIVEVARQFCTQRTGFLVLLGDYGTGKTHLAVAALRGFKSGWLVKQGSLLRALRDTYNDKTSFDPIERAQSARLLILDEVGFSGGGRDELPMLHEILDYRHGERLPTIITSNLQFEQLTNAIGERMADRLRESAFRVLTFAGPSRRRNARERYFASPPPEFGLRFGKSQ